MRKFFVAVFLTVACIAALTPDSEAFLRRRRSPPPCPPCPCPCPPSAFAPPFAPSAPTALVIKGRAYRLTETGERGDFAHDRVPPPAPGQAPCPDDGETYCGTARRKAKLSIADAPMQNYSNLGLLLDSLNHDDEMMALGISTSATSDRVMQEQRNVNVRAWVYAFKKEDDRDYHLILGTDPDLPASQRRLMNVEISGLPTAPGATRDTLKGVRTAFKGIMQEFVFTNQSYKRFDPPVPVEVAGSLFYDVNHPPGVVGPSGLKPATSWEIHPVTKIAVTEGP